jgi:hypothetical protein
MVWLAPLATSSFCSSIVRSPQMTPKSTLVSPIAYVDDLLQPLVYTLKIAERSL